MIISRAVCPRILQTLTATHPELASQWQHKEALRRALRAVALYRMGGHPPLTGHSALVSVCGVEISGRPACHRPDGAACVSAQLRE